MTAPRPISTLSLLDAAKREWDVLVVGAGPAGALAARQIASAGMRTLLVDKSTFPRWKVCGCCLNGAALQALQTVGLSELPSRLSARPLDRWHLATTRRSVVCRLAAGVALSREAFDAALVEEAIRAGTDFLPETTAVLREPVETSRSVRLGQKSVSATLQAKVVVGASGLHAEAWRGHPDLLAQTRRNSRIGVGAVVDDSGDFFQAGTIYMSYSRDGYVGLVRLEDGRLDVAAALNVQAARRAGGPGAAVQTTLEHVGWPLPSGFGDAAWRGTPALTRAPKRIFGERLLLVGDAAGYIEPFTGEGIAWALRSAVTAADLIVRGVEHWSPAIGTRWSRLYRRKVGRRQIVCHAVARLLRSSFAAETVAFALAHIPWLAYPVIRFINTPPRCRLGRGNRGMQRVCTPRY